MIHVNNLYSDNILFRKLASSFKIEEFFIKLMKNQSKMDVNIFINQINNICPEVGKKLKQLMEYKLKFTSSEDRYLNSDFSRKSIKAPILELATEQNLFDMSIDYVCKEVEDWFKGVEILLYTEINNESLPIILKFLRDNKKKMDLSYYQKVMKIEEKGQLELSFFEEEEVTKFELETQEAA